MLQSHAGVYVKIPAASTVVNLDAALLAVVIGNTVRPALRFVLVPHAKLRSHIIVIKVVWFILMVKVKTQQVDSFVAQPCGNLDCNQACCAVLGKRRAIAPP